MFTTQFSGYVGEAISCEVDGFTITARLERDDCQDAPWEREDGHGPVSWWTSRDKSPGERVLNADRGSRRYYDFAEAVKIAKRDGWGGEGRTAGERAAHAANADFERLRRWCADQWEYVGVCVTVEKEGVRLTGPYDHALWGVESDAGEYLTEVANEYLTEALNAARAKVEALNG